jgi:hypothetical protein
MNFFQNFSQSLAICFDLFSFGEFVYSEITDSGPHLSAAARRVGPAHSAPLPRGRHAPRRRRGLKLLSGQRAAHPDSCLDRVAPRPTAASRPPRACRRRARQPPRSRHRPDCHGLKPSTPAPSPSRAAPSSPRRFPRRLPCAGAEPPPARRAAPRAAHCASGPRAVSAQWHPVKFYYFLIYSIYCKFKNLCRIHLNSENYETNFV